MLVVVRCVVGVLIVDDCVGLLGLMVFRIQGLLWVFVLWDCLSNVAWVVPFLFRLRVFLVVCWFWYRLEVGVVFIGCCFVQGCDMIAVFVIFCVWSLGGGLMFVYW